MRRNERDQAVVRALLAGPGKHMNDRLDEFVSAPHDEGSNGPRTESESLPGSSRWRVRACSFMERRAVRGGVSRTCSGVWVSLGVQWPVSVTRAMPAPDGSTFGAGLS